ncbi:MAG: hypothetical protein WAZ19_06365 [Anaerolineae bacterium]
MQQSFQNDRDQNKQKWQEPTILVERPLVAKAQEPGPDMLGPSFGPLSTTGF